MVLRTAMRSKRTAEAWFHIVKAGERNPSVRGGQSDAGGLRRKTMPLLQGKQQLRKARQQNE
ncbi:MAG TPA: hypothetical protein VL996_12560 [Methylocella sp.]|nr:hypothetical protein [Methylocella sp.]